MNNNEIQIVAFNNPYPPDFGGAIDVYYKIKALKEIGVKIHLHIYYDDRNDVSGLTHLCESIYLYKKDAKITKHFSLLPYAVSSRISNELVDNLNKSEAPILFESVRTTGVLLHNQFNQKTAVRCHNIESDYSFGLFKSERNWIKKVAFLIEGCKFQYYESVLEKVDFLFTLSFHEQSYYKKKFVSKSVFLPVFHNSEKIESINGFGTYALYHGDLSVADNLRSAFFMISVFKDLNEPLIIASSTIIPALVNKIGAYKNISFQHIANKEQLDDLIQNAHINVLYSFQNSGTKLKVFTALYKGRHCILNKNMIDDPDILRHCDVVDNKNEYQMAIKRLFTKEFILNEERNAALKKYDSQGNASQLMKILG